jgi:Complex I intermediate-associated protein 30 (CIA30)
MGQAMRMMSYDRAANERNAVSALSFARNSSILTTDSMMVAATSASPPSLLVLKWHRLDDGVMGGQSETNAIVQSRGGDGSDSNEIDDHVLRFAGTINTIGGGFASLRAPIPAGTLSSSSSSQQDDMTGLKLVFRGDGKTYKFLLSDGSGGGPWAKTPSWQIDVPTQALISLPPPTAAATTPSAEAAVSDSHDTSSNNYVTWQEAFLPFDSFLPNMGPGRRVQQQEQQHHHVLDPAAMQQMGIMLSLLKANNEPNPPETFGPKGSIFPFCLEIQSIQPVFRPTQIDQHQHQPQQQQQCQDDKNDEGI